MVQKNYKRLNLIQFQIFNKKFNNYNYKLPLKNKIVNCLMINGKKQVSEKIFFETLKLLHQSSFKNIKNILKFSLINITPIIAVRQNKKKNRIINEIPFLLNPSLRMTIAIKNIIKNTKKQSNHFFSENLKSEFINILKKNSENLIQKTELQKYALKKKAFTHFRWF
jgi:small subunit ribosomal protein S7